MPINVVFLQLIVEFWNYSLYLTLENLIYYDY